MAFVAGLSGNVATCSTNINGRIVRVRSISTGDVSVGSDPRGIS